MLIAGGCTTTTTGNPAGKQPNQAQHQPDRGIATGNNHAHTSIHSNNAVGKKSTSDISPVSTSGHSKNRLLHQLKHQDSHYNLGSDANYLGSDEYELHDSENIFTDDDDVTSNYNNNSPDVNDEGGTTSVIVSSPMVNCAFAKNTNLVVNHQGNNRGVLSIVSNESDYLARINVSDTTITDVKNDDELYISEHEKSNNGPDPEQRHQQSSSSAASINDMNTGLRYRKQFVNSSSVLGRAQLNAEFNERKRKSSITTNSANDENLTEDENTELEKSFASAMDGDE